MLHSLIYVSKISGTSDQTELQIIRDQAISINRASGITGLLLHTPGYFCQLLQGPKLSVEQTMLRIKRDNRHSNPVVVLRTRLLEEFFPDWSMATRRIFDGQTAADIARMHGTGHTSPEDLDHLINVIQCYRLGRSVAYPVLSTLSSVDGVSKFVNETPAEEGNRNTGNRNYHKEVGIDSLLKLGAFIFDNTDLVLLLRQPGEQGLQVRTTIDSLPNPLLTELSLSQDHGYMWDETDSHHSGSATLLKGEPPDSISKLCTALEYHCAEGYVIKLGPGALPQEMQRANAATPARYPVASVWFLQRVPRLNTDEKTRRIRKQHALCIGDHLEQHRFTFENALLQRKSRRQQLEMQAIAERQDLVLNIASSAIVALDEKCSVLMINDTGRTLFGLEEMQVPFLWPEQISFLDAVKQTPLDAALHPIKNSIAKGIEPAPSSMGSSFSSEAGVVLLAKEGEKSLCLRYSSVPVPDSDSSVAFVIVFDDITELEVSREQRRDERFVALEHLTSGIAHDFNNLLATILNSVELAVIEEGATEKKQLLDLAIDTVHRGTGLTNRLVAFSTAQPLPAEIHRLSDILKAVQKLAKSRVGPKINLIIECVAEGAVAKCDSRQLENALLNLIINSRDAIVSSGIGSRITVSSRILGVADLKLPDLKLPGLNDQDNKLGCIEIAVTDDGPGMPPLVLQHAIDPFFTTKARADGSGLGLSMVYRFVRRCYGELFVENITAEHASGLSVRMLIPRARDRADTLADGVAAKVPLSELVVGNQLKILLVEDDITLGALLCKMLQGMGHQVSYVSCADQARALLEGPEVYELLITDVIMPGGKLDGIRLASQAVESRPDLKVIYVSGFVEYQKEDKAALHGPLLYKPVSVRKMAAVIQQVSEDLESPVC